MVRIERSRKYKGRIVLIIGRLMFHMSRTEAINLKKQLQREVPRGK